MNRRLAANPPSVIRRIGETAASIPGCLRLTIGEPDFDAPLSVRQRIAEAIAGGDTHYPPNAGIMPLRRETAAYLNGRFGSDYLPEETLITVGSTEALGSALFAILNPGDEVICLTPCFGLYKPLIEMAGGVYRPLPRGEGITKEKLAQARTALETSMRDRERARQRTVRAAEELERLQAAGPDRLRQLSVDVKLHSG